MINAANASMYHGETLQHRPARNIEGEFVSLLGDKYYKIKNYDAMSPFFMSIVSGSNHWLFISSTGGLSAGRVNAEQALFPYYTEDRLAENYENTGHKSILRVTRAGRASLWEPFSKYQQGSYSIERNIYKNVLGTAVLFEEINHSLGLVYRYAWRTGDRFGFVKTSWLVNTSDMTCQIELIDGIQNLLPPHVTSLTQNTFSCLLDAYKRSELDPETGLGLFALNSTLTDLAEPSESLLATTVLQVGLDPIGYLLSSEQIDSFRADENLVTESQVRGRRCAYFVQVVLDLNPGDDRCWHLVADVSQDGAAIVELRNLLRKKREEFDSLLQSDIAENNSSLEKIVAIADGLQLSADPLCTSHHFANVMFNVMRGGVFADQYRIQKQDLMDFVSARNRDILAENSAFFSELPIEMDILDLQTQAHASGKPDLMRLVYAYLPLSFSRRHGDPSRPWNRFAIDIKKQDGSLKLGYEGNWRDIFQNWEALAWSYPEYVESMICTFLNATTADGYNPYRITRDGIDWESPEPNNPWANIGYWSDHQIVYLQKLMEISSKVHPGRLQAFLSQAIFSHANVPYRIKPYAEVLQDPFNTISYDWALDKEMHARVQNLGADGKLVRAAGGRVLHTNMTEKLMILLLTKLANLVPEGGIWMNTQRPEWNDANNALVGKGLSVVTLCYLRRTLVFFNGLLRQSGLSTILLGEQVGGFYGEVGETLQSYRDHLKGSFSDMQRRLFMDALGRAASEYRWDYYRHGVSGQSVNVDVKEIVAFLELAQEYVEHSIRANRREDKLYHAYNVLHLGKELASLNRLDEMLEGQVAALSSGMLSGEESLSLLESLRQGRLYRPDQHSYTLYPDRTLPGLLEKNCLTPEQVRGIGLLQKLVENRDKSLVVRDEEGNYHFSGHIHNVKDVARALDTLGKHPDYAEIVRNETEQIKILFEENFHHNQFTGRSGTFFAYEGLGSIYWHMVSKLLLAIQETILRTREEPTTQALVEKYIDIRKGLSFNKPPDVYGAFPTDPYSHTPKGQGARQPGMSGMVKEEILTRRAELGFFVEDGRIAFDFLLLDKKEFTPVPTVFRYWNVAGKQEQIDILAGSVAYSICQVPVILHATDKISITIHHSDGNVQVMVGNVLDADNSRHILQRDGRIHHLEVSCHTHSS